MRRNGLISLIAIVALAAAGLVLTLVANNSILLGIDLEGGAEVVLVPVADTTLEGGDLDEALDQSVEIIRNRVDSLGVAEPDITKQGERIVVQMPGIEDQKDALEVVGQTAALRFRPVCALVSPFFDTGSLEDGTDPLVLTDVVTSGNSLTGESNACDSNVAALAGSIASSNRVQDQEENPVILEDRETGERYYLGPTIVTGAALETADATSPNGVDWTVAPIFNSGSPGINEFNQASALCFNQTAICPTGRLAIALDGVVYSAPNVNTPSFARDQITISGDFTQGEAEDVALVLKFGALPLEFQDPTEQGSDSTVRQVSATLGRDSLDAGLTAGMVGLFLVALFMLAYYRFLGLAALLSLGVSGTLLYVILAFLSSSQGLALSLAGVVGLIVSIGTSLDSNVVYFEHLKEDIASGRTMRSSVDRSFPVAFKTIFWANLASLIAAAILYFLTIGSVKGFALMLGLASILDLIATYFFLRPLVQWWAGTSRLSDRPSLFGLPAEGAHDESVRRAQKSEAQDTVESASPSFLGKLYSNTTSVDFTQLWRKFMVVSAVLIVVSLGAVLARGFNLGLDFEGGAAWEVADTDVDTSDVRDALGEIGFADARIQTGGDVLRVRAELQEGDAAVADVTAVLQQVTGASEDDISLRVAGPSWGNEITDKARNALIVFFLVIALYITVRLRWQMAAGALAAVVHDILITVGIYALFQLEITPSTVIAFLTIMGYSLYDTLVVFDKARDNEHRMAQQPNMDYPTIMNASLNQVLARSINTSITSVLPVFSVLLVGSIILGAVTLREFAVALLIGLIVGTFSSIFVAAPISTWLRRNDDLQAREMRLSEASRSKGSTGRGPVGVRGDDSKTEKKSGGLKTLTRKGDDETSSSKSGAKAKDKAKDTAKDGAKGAGKKASAASGSATKAGSKAKDAAKGATDAAKKPSGTIPARPRKQKRR